MTTRTASSLRTRSESGSGSASSAVGLGSFCAGGFSELVPLDGDAMINKKSTYRDLMIFSFDESVGVPNYETSAGLCVSEENRHKMC